MAAKKAAASKAAVSKAAAKTAAKKVAKKTASGAKVTESDLTQIATEVLAGKHGTGRERDIALRAAGHDPVAVQRETAKLRGAQHRENYDPRAGRPS